MKPFFKFFSLLAIIFFGCQNSDRDLDNTTNTSMDYATGQSIVSSIFKIVHQAANSSPGITTSNLSNSGSIFNCDTIIVDTLSTPNRVTIDFENDCSNNNLIRNGKIIITFSGKYDAVGSTATVTFSNYKHGDFSIRSGSVSYTYRGLINAIPNYSQHVNSLTVENSNTDNIIWSGNQNISITSGSSTASFADDTYIISGDANGRTFRGNGFSATITSDLRLIGSCNWPSSGIITINPENKTTRFFDFGAICDNEAIVTLFNTDYEITIP